MQLSIKNGQEYAILAKDGGMNPVLEIYFSGKENTVQGISAQGSTAAGSKTITTIFNNTDSKNIINGEIKAHNVFASNFTAKGTINIIFKGSNNTINGKIIALGELIILLLKEVGLLLTILSKQTMG